MKRNFIVDQEIKLLDKTDFLNTKVYSDTLQKMIVGSPENKPFTIGLFGDWGSGKSSIIKTAREELEQSKDFKTRFVTFDAWKYSEDAFRRSFIISISKQLNVELDKREYNLYENLAQQISDFKIKISKSTWIITGLISIATIAGLIACYLAFPWFKDNALKLFSIIVLFFTTSTLVIAVKKILNKDIVAKLLNYLQSIFLVKYDEERPLMFSPEQFSNAFDHIVSQVTNNYDRLIIVIDNIDRCERQYATELLGTVKGFLESKEKVLFVIPVDETALKRHIKEAHKADDKEADEFLRKFFNTTLRIKPYNTSEIYVFANSINDKYQLNFSDYTIDLVSKEYASNPRRIIQMFNNLTTELECFSDQSFAEKQETVICKLLILREEFPEYYYRLSQNPYLLSAPIENYKTEPDNLWNLPLAKFLNKTKVITENIPVKDLNRILSNSIVFSALPAEIENYIENLQIDEIKGFISEDNTKFNIVIDYLIRQLEIYRDRNLIGNSLINALDLLIDLDADKQLNTTTNKRIEEYIAPVLGTIFEQKSNFNKLIGYSWSLVQQKRQYLIKFIIESIKANLSLEEQSIKWIDALKEGIYIYRSSSILKQLSDPFFEYYQRDNLILSTDRFTEDQVNNLISDKLIHLIIDSIVNLADSSKPYLDLLFILKNRSNSVEVEQRVISRINDVYPNFIGVSHSEVTTRLNSINDLISKLRCDFTNDVGQLQTLSSLIFGERYTPNPSYPTNRQFDTRYNYINECIAGEDGITELLVFCKNIFRLTKNQVNVTNVLQQIISANKFQESINELFIELLEDDVPLTSAVDLIYQDNTYTESALKLFKYIFELNENGQYILTDEKLSVKLSEIFDLIFTDDSKKASLEAFLESLSKNDRVKKLLITCISVQTKQNILRLSNVLQSLSIDIVLEGDKVFDFADNIDFLKAIANNGNNSHIKKLTKVIIAKLQHDDELENAFSIILELNRLPKADARRIIQELENQSDNEILKEKIQEIYNHIKKITIDS